MVGDQLRGGRPVHPGQLLLGQLVSVEGGGPGLDVHHVGGFFGFQEFDHLQAFVTFSQQKYFLVYKNILLPTNSTLYKLMKSWEKYLYSGVLPVLLVKKSTS